MIFFFSFIFSCYENTNKIIDEFPYRYIPYRKIENDKMNAALKFYSKIMQNKPVKYCFIRKHYIFY